MNPSPDDTYHKLIRDPFRDVLVKLQGGEENMPSPPDWARTYWLRVAEEVDIITDETLSGTGWSVSELYAEIRRHYDQPI